jgi:exosortase
VCAISGALIFQFLGSSTRGYIGTSSLFYWWGFQWLDPRSETQHGILILGISAWLVVRNLRAAPPRVPGEGRGPAVAAMVAGLLVHAVGFVAQQARLSVAGLLLYAWGLASFAGGPRWARATAFPLVFMVFAIPLSALDTAGFWLRMWVVGASSRIAHALGIGVLVNGTQLLSPDGRYNYDVAAACSGVRSLVALAALSLLVGYLRFRPRWLWAAMLAASFPLVFVGNVARIVSIIVAAQVGGRQWGDWMHEVMGFGVFAIVLGGVFCIAELAARWRPGWASQGPAPVLSEPAPAAAHGPGEKGLSGPWAGAVGVAAACALTAVALVHVSHRAASERTGVALAADGLNPVDLPVFLGTDWIGRRSEVSDIERQILPADTGYSRTTYVSLEDPTKQVFLSIVLSGRDRTSIHRPELCLVSQGWTIRGSFLSRFVFPGTSTAFPATVLRVEKDVATPRGRVVVPQLFAYYFVGSDRVVATHWERLARDAWDRVVHGRSDRWAYVVVQTGDSDGETAALERIQTILDATLPAFQRHG